MPIKGAVPFLLACGFEDKVLPVEGILLLWYPETQFQLCAVSLRKRHLYLWGIKLKTSCMQFDLEWEVTEWTSEIKRNVSCPFYLWFLQLIVCLFYFCLYGFFRYFFPLLRCMCSSINIENSAKLWKVHPSFDPSKSVLVLRNDLEWSVRAQRRDCLEQMVVTITLILFFLISLRFVLIC